jgi:ABC-2 type transport system permease protein
VGVVLLALVPFFIATLSMGTWISHRFRQETTAMQILLPLSLPILMLSGFSWPTEKMPLWLQWLAWPLPSSHAILAFLRIQQAGASLSEILSYWRSLWLVAAFWSFLLGWEYWRTRKRR